MISRNRVPGWLEQAIRVPDFLKSRNQFPYFDYDSCLRIAFEIGYRGGSTRVLVLELVLVLILVLVLVLLLLRLLHGELAIAISSVETR